MVVRKSDEDFFSSSTFLGQPWIIQSHPDRQCKHIFIDPISGTRAVRAVPEIQGKCCFGCFDKHLFLWDDKTRRFCFLNLTSTSEIHLPRFPVHFDCLQYFSISSSLDHRDCIIFAIRGGVGNRTFVLFCRLNDAKWTKLPVDIGEDFLRGMSIVHQGKLYMQSFKAIVVFDVPSLIARNAKKKKIIEAPEFPLYPSGNACKSHLVESNGDIFFVRTQRYGPSGPVLSIDIYRLEISSEEIWESDEIISNEVWKKVDSIGDRVFFLEDTRGMSACAKDVGVRGNCVYSMMSCYGEERLCKLCLDDQTFSFSFLSAETRCWSPFSWILPTRPQRMRESISTLSNLALNEVNQEEEEEEARAEVYGPWHDLTVILQLVLPFLSLADVGRLRTVCKEWSLFLDPFAKVQTWPWLMYREKPDGTYRFLDPLCSTQSTMKINELSLDENECVVTICAKDGWIVLLLDDCTILMINPFFQNIRVVPPLLETALDGITFSSVPTSPDSIVFGIASSLTGDSVKIFGWSPATDEETWDEMEFENGVVFRLARSNPVFFRGEFYCLGETGSLGVFNPIDKTWKILHDLKPLYSEDDDFITGIADCYLLESQEELICVHKYNNTKADISVFKLDQTTMAWSKLEDIGDMTIFLDPRCSLVKLLPNKRWANKIFSPAFDPSNACPFYCMERQTHSMKLYQLKEPVDCVWLEPNLWN